MQENPFQNRWLQTWQAIQQDGRQFKTSYRRYTLAQRQIHHIEQLGHGLMLDVGAGMMTYRDTICNTGAVYLGMDVQQMAPGLALLGSGESLPFVNDCIDGIFCSQVIEHVPRPWIFIQELARVLKPGGVLILSAPFMYYVHGAPHDYYRYSHYGLQLLAEEAGLANIQTERIGGFLAFISYFLQIAILYLTYPRSGLIREAGWALNQAINWIVAPLDKRFGLVKLMPQSILLVAQKPTL